jgi:putative phage-type endonuclease
MTQIAAIDGHPSADVISTAAPETDEWFEVRRNGITATDIPKILGLSPYGNALSVYHDKRGELPPDEAGEAARWGQRLENVVAKAWAEENGVIVDPIGVMANRDEPWQRAALDRICRTCPDTGEWSQCALEVKTRSAFKAGSWREDIPDDVLAQVAWQRLVSGVDHVHVAVLIGGQRMKSFRYDTEPSLEEYLIEQAATVWDCVTNGVPPVVDSSTALLSILDRMFPDRTGAVEVDAAEVARLKAEYDEAHAVAKSAEGGKDWAKYRMVALLGGAAQAIDADGEVLATYKPTMRATPDLDRLKVEFPDAYKACVVKKPTAPSLKFTNPKGA